MQYYVYILLCKDGSYYTGYTKDLESRLEQHVLGRGARYTRMHKPEKLVYLEGFATRREAMSRERWIKRLTHGEKLKLVGSCVKWLDVEVAERRLSRIKLLFSQVPVRH